MKARFDGPFLLDIFSKRGFERWDDRRLFRFRPPLQLINLFGRLGAWVTLESESASSGSSKIARERQYVTYH
ncbi:MAG: hypothetical protein ACO1NU_07060 [Arcticibacter sp.]